MDLFVGGVPPLIYAAPGGLYVNIDGDLLSSERENRDWSLGRLATELGVSRRTVSKYEDGMNASIEVAIQLEELFDRPFSSPVEVLDGAEEVRDAEPTPEDPEAVPDDHRIIAIMRRAGFDVQRRSHAADSPRRPSRPTAGRREREGAMTDTPPAWGWSGMNDRVTRSLRRCRHRHGSRRLADSPVWRYFFRVTDRIAGRICVRPTTASANSEVPSFSASSRLRSRS